jgi:hypothetical protein
MGAPEFAMTVIGGLASVAAGLVYTMISRENAQIPAAKACAWLSAIGFGSLGVIWGSTNANYSLGLRVAAAASVAAVVAGALTWIIADINGQSKGPVAPSDTEAVARLTELGWTVRPSKEDYIFEIAGQSLPAMQPSAAYFKQLRKPFRLHFQSVKGLEGLHYLADAEGCKTIEISAGEFTDISELGNLTHLTKLVISQVPLSGVGTVDGSPLASLINLEELNLNITRVRAVDFLSSLTHLKTLYLIQTLITDIDPISAIGTLEHLDIRGTRVTDLQPVRQNQRLRELSIGGEQIPGLTALTTLKNLKRLSVIEQRNVDLSP